MAFLRTILWPVSVLYAMAMFIRNICFDLGLLPSSSYQLPVICVGNLSLGGTGKTPHTEYLVRLLGKRMRIAVLSRGYKRNTSGYRVVTGTSLAEEVGDEPLQIRRKFPAVVVAVSESRRKGIDRILQEYPDTELIILDDAFQHRYVRSGLNLLLTKYARPYFNDDVFPTGNLRECKSGAKRADAVIVTGSPDHISPDNRHLFTERIKKHGPENVFFSGLRYAKPLPVWGSSAPENPGPFNTIFVLSAIADPAGLEQYLAAGCNELIPYRFRDHHVYKPSELRRLKEHFLATTGGSKAIITTEKDAVRLQTGEAQSILKGLPVFYIPVEVVFRNNDQARFERLIAGFLMKNA